MYTKAITFNLRTAVFIQSNGHHLLTSTLELKELLSLSEPVAECLRQIEMVLMGQHGAAGSPALEACYAAHGVQATSSCIICR